jgi:hypothetical protein
MCISVDATPLVVEKLGAMVSCVHGAPRRFFTPPQRSATQTPR